MIIGFNYIYIKTWMRLMTGNPAGKCEASIELMWGPVHFEPLHLRPCFQAQRSEEGSLHGYG